VVDDGLREGRTRVDANPFALDEPAEDATGFEDSLATTPAHLRPVAGRTEDSGRQRAAAEPGSGGDRIVPRTLPPTTEGVAAPLADRLPLPAAVAVGPSPPAAPSPAYDTPSPAAPIAHSQPRPLADTAAAVAPRRRRSPLVVAAAVLGGLALLFALAIGIAYVTWLLCYWGGHCGDSSGATTRVDLAATPLSAHGQAGAPDDLVGFEIHSVPPGAAVVLDGRPLGTTPYRTSMPRGDEERQLEVRAAGFVPVARAIRFDQAHRLELELQPDAPVRPGGQ
jgi:hypothetical protein